MLGYPSIHIYSEEERENKLCGHFTRWLSFVRCKGKTKDGSWLDVICNQGSRMESIPYEDRMKKQKRPCGRGALKIN